MAGRHPTHDRPARGAGTGTRQPRGPVIGGLLLCLLIAASLIVVAARPRAEASVANAVAPRAVLPAATLVPVPDAPEPSIVTPTASEPSLAIASGAPDASPGPLPSADASDTPVASPTSAEPERLHGYDWPLYRGRMTSYFGPWPTGFLMVDDQRIHPGLDTTTWCGDSVKAAHAGTVLAAGRRFAEAAGFEGDLDAFYARLERRGEMGLLPIVVVIDDGNGYRSMYVHLADATVKVGQKVRKGQIIGIEGDTGNASGCHVHYELIRMDGPLMRVAPELVREYKYPRYQRERVDPLRVLSMRQKRAGRRVPGILRPKLPPSLRAPRDRPAAPSSPPPSPTPQG